MLKQYLHEIYYLIGDDKKRIPGFLVLFLVLSVLDLVGLGLIGSYITLAISPESIVNSRYEYWLTWLGLPKDQKLFLITIGLILLAAFSVKFVASIGINFVTLRFSLDQQFKLKNFLMQSYQSMSYVDYVNRNSSEYIHSIQNLTGQFSTILLILVRSAGDIIIATSIFIFLAFTNGLALLILVSLFGVMIFSYDYIFRHKMQNYGAKSNQVTVSMVQGIREGVDGLKEVRILGKSSYFLNKVVESAKKYKLYQIRIQTISSIPRYLLELAVVSFIVVIVVVMLSFGGGINDVVYILGIFGVAAIRLMPIFSNFSSTLNQIRHGRDTISRLYRDVLNFKSRQTLGQPLADEIVEDKFQHLQLKRLSYSYPGSSVATLKSVSLKIEEGESIGIIGSSGSGKTTLIDIILGLLRVNDNSIFYNNLPLTDALSMWRSKIAYLPQQVFLINDTLRNNIALGVNSSDINDIKLNKAILQARLSQLVKQLPNGVDTKIGERGIRLSGGQRQRVALARAFYHDRSVLVMDEATSALDNATEKEIVSEIREFQGRKTIIVVAHRLTTLQYCDRIYEIDKGKVVNVGSYNEIFNKV